MRWNNGRERKLFEKQQAEFRKQYIAAGMTEEQIQAMYDYDKAVLNGRQREARHTQRLDVSAFDEESDESKNPLLEKFLDNLTVEIDRNEVNRYAWIDEIENERLYKAIKFMPRDYIEILTDMVIDGLTQTEIAEKRKVVKSAIANKINRVRKIIKNFLDKA